MQRSARGLDAASDGDCLPTQAEHGHSVAGQHAPLHCPTVTSSSANVAVDVVTQRQWDAGLSRLPPVTVETVGERSRGHAGGCGAFAGGTPALGASWAAALGERRLVLYS